LQRRRITGLPNRSLGAVGVLPQPVVNTPQTKRPIEKYPFGHGSIIRLFVSFATTNDHHLGTLGALGLGPRNIGYHIVHHIHPQVRLGALPRLRAWSASQHPDTYPRSRR
jgi:hypothetical protein